MYLIIKKISMNFVKLRSGFSNIHIQQTGLYPRLVCRGPVLYLTRLENLVYGCILILYNVGLKTPAQRYSLFYYHCRK